MEKRSEVIILSLMRVRQSALPASLTKGTPRLLFVFIMHMEIKRLSEMKAILPIQSELPDVNRTGLSSGVRDKGLQKTDLYIFL